MLGIDQIVTTLERMHGTLKPMLAKACERELDWSEWHCLPFGKSRTGTWVSPHTSWFMGEVCWAPWIFYIQGGWMTSTRELTLRSGY